MTNFEYLSKIPVLEDLYRLCNEAEKYLNANAEVSAMYSRKALEAMVKIIYVLKGIEYDDKQTLGQLIYDSEFQSFIDDPMTLRNMQYVHHVGNVSHHSGSTVTRKQALFCLEDLYNFVGAVFLKLGVLKSLSPFREDLIPTDFSIHVSVKETEPEPSQEVKEEFEGKLTGTLSVDQPKDFSEAETRKLFIDKMLEEAGWEVMQEEGMKAAGKACIEIELAGMPNNEGKGYADYIMYNTDGKPLAVVEAKKTSKDPLIGKKQAQLYGECLRNVCGYTPVIYYTNGYKTYIIDGLGYPAREVYGFHTIKDLQVLIQRQGRKDMSDLAPDKEIAGRDYQIMAVRNMCDWLNKKHRRGLLVMATGTGKTRVSISLTELLMRNNWVKNVLFLADRTTLVEQAYDNYVKLLPNNTKFKLSDNTVSSEEKKKYMDARIMFSTYQTMIHYIDRPDKPFSIGRFDLIIIDEAHRSVFGKFGAIFSYFDSLLIGLTATPRDEIEKNTYTLLGLDDGKPNFAYELQEAVDDGYLVSYKVFKTDSAILDNGIRYQDLTDNEKKQVEKIYEHEQAGLDMDPESYVPHDFSKDQLFTYLFNIDTVDKVLQELMKKGICVESGEKIGKTIIFAYNHEHAALIVKRFQALYPNLGADYCQLIDYQTTYSKNIISDFKMADGNPRIAVSVDMLDTGVDVPEVVNLVFFKVVRSKIKFNQMIGRGTRLCPNLFGPKQDKKEFYIFDYLHNFDFFDLHPNNVEEKRLVSLTEKIFDLRLDIAVALQRAEYQEEGSFSRKFHDELKEQLCAQVRELPFTRVDVSLNKDIVYQYQQKESWQYVSQVESLHIKDRIGPLLDRSADNESAKKFDILVLALQLSKVDTASEPGLAQAKIMKIADLLEKKGTIPQVKAKMKTIKEVQTEAFWENADLEGLERIRKEMRDLVKFLGGRDDTTFEINIEDTFTSHDPADGKPTEETYKEHVLEYLAEHTKDPALQKIFNLEQLTEFDIRQLEQILWHELGTEEDYKKYLTHEGKMLYGGNVAAFIRTVIGIDRKKAHSLFAGFLQQSELNPLQEECLKAILNYVCSYGDMAKQKIGEKPFKDMGWSKKFGKHLSGVGHYLDFLHKVITLPGNGYNGPQTVEDKLA